jgi:hypothetical protein
MPLSLKFRPSRLASPKISAFADYLVECWRCVQSLRPNIVRTNERTTIQFFNRANGPWYTKQLNNRIS